MTEPAKDIGRRFIEAQKSHQSGDIAAATRLYQSILADQPRHPDALHMLGVVAQQADNAALALNLIEASLAVREDAALPWYNRALVLRKLKRDAEALKSTQIALTLDPALAVAWDIAGVLLREQNRFEEARDAHARAVALAPNNPLFLSNHAALLLQTGDPVAALRVAMAADKLQANIAPLTLGNIWRDLGYPEKAAACYNAARRLMPALAAEADFSAGMAHLLMGDFGTGWPLFEHRPDSDPKLQKIPLWQGGSARHLLLHEDQGLGDALQCLRFIPLLRPFAACLTLYLSPVLRRLVAANFPDLEIITPDDPLPPADARLRLMSLPGLFKAHPGAMQTAFKLQAPVTWQAPWRAYCANLPPPRIGLVWSGNPAHRNDHNRSLKPAQVAPLFQHLGPHLVSLQKGSAASALPAGLCDAASHLDDFAALAGLIETLDLVISVDTAPAHLAGMLGKPVWILLPFLPDWRWLLGREDSPWYPTARLFRQEKPSSWPQVVARVMAEAERLIAGDQTVLTPQPWPKPALRQHPQAIAL